MDTGLTCIKLQSDSCDVRRFWVTKIVNNSLLAVWHKLFRLDEGVEQNSTENFDFTDAGANLHISNHMHKVQNRSASYASVTV